MSTDLRPLYMWAGGKTKLIKSYRGLWPDMADYDNYVEPFFGGGAIYAWINSDPGAGHIRHHIGDVNTELMGVITAIKTDPDGFVRSTQRLARQMLKLKTKQHFTDQKSTSKYGVPSDENLLSQPTKLTLRFLLGLVLPSPQKKEKWKHRFVFTEHHSVLMNDLSDF